MIWYDMIWYDMIWYDMIWYDCNVTREYRFLVVQDIRRPLVTTLRNELRNAVGVTISTQPVRNHLRQSGLQSRRACIRIPLTRLHQQARLTGLTITSTGLIPTGILYSSPLSQGTVFTLQIDILKCGEDVRSDFKMPTSSNMTTIVEAPLWCGLVLAEVEEQTCTSWWQTWWRAIGPQFIVMDETARPHRARVVEDYLQQETIVRMDWPARWPGLNPIEHVCNMLQVAISRRPVQLPPLMELGNALTEEWNNLEMAAIQRFIGSMRRRCQAVIASCGSHTSYWQLLLLVIGTFSWHFWEGLLLWWHNVLPIMSSKKQTLSKMFKFGIQEINISPNTCHFLFLRDTNTY